MKSRLAMVILGVLVTCISAPASAVYNANMNGVVSDVLIYADADYIYFRLENQPTAHPGCNPAYFVLTGIPDARLSRLAARLMMAKATGEYINIGYDNSGDCATGYIRAHRIG